MWCAFQDMSIRDLRLGGVEDSGTNVGGVDAWSILLYESGLIVWRRAVLGQKAPVRGERIFPKLLLLITI